MTLVFLGSHTVIEGIAELSRFGEQVSVDDDLGELLLKRGNFMRAPDFSRIGFTSQELTEFAEVWRHAEAPQRFLDKKRRALVLAQGGTPPPLPMKEEEG